MKHRLPQSDIRLEDIALLVFHTLFVDNKIQEALGAISDAGRVLESDREADAVRVGREGLEVFDSVGVFEWEAGVVVEAVDFGLGLARSRKMRGRVKREGSTIIGIHAITPLALCGINSRFHDIHDKTASSIQPFLIWPTIHNFSNHSFIGQDLCGIRTVGLVGSAGEVADYFLAAGVESVDCGLGCCVQVDVVEVDWEGEGPDVGFQHALPGDARLGCVVGYGCFGGGGGCCGCGGDEA